MKYNFDQTLDHRYNHSYHHHAVPLVDAAYTFCDEARLQHIRG